MKSIRRHRGPNLCIGQTQIDRLLVALPIHNESDEQVRMEIELVIKHFLDMLMRVFHRNQYELHTVFFQFFRRVE